MSFPRYPKYKASGVEWLGDVPEHWEVSRLSIVTDILAGHSFDASLFGFDGIPVIRMSDFGDGLVQLEDAKRVDSTNVPEKSLARSGDVLLGLSGSISNFAVVREQDLPIAINQRVAVVRIHEAQRGSVKWFLQSTEFINQLTAELPETTIQNISMAQLRRCKLPSPPQDEQTLIASFLDRETSKIDGLVGEQRRLIELLKEKRQAVISHAVTKGLNPHAPLKPSGIEWLGDVPEHWGVMRLKHVKSDDKNAFVDGPFGSNLKSEHFIDNGDAYVIESGFATQGRLDVADLKTISLDHFRTVSRSETKGGDIIIAKIGAQFGKSSILPTLDKPAVVSGNSLKLTINPQRCEVKFVHWHLTNLKQLGAIDDIVNGTAQPALSLGEMNNLPMLVPPLDEQQAIVNYLETQLQEFDALTAEAERGIELLQERRTALISAAVTGQIDVRGLVETGEAA